MVQSSVDGVPSSRRWRRRLAAVLLIAILALAVAAVGLLTYIAAEASETLVYGDDAPHGCATPAVMGWDYEAVNYDIALDTRLPIDNPDWLTDCPIEAMSTAGDEVVSEDGIRIGRLVHPVRRWRPADRADGRRPPRLGHCTPPTRSRYAATMHDRYNLLLVELRSRGRSSGEQMTPFGVREYRDLKAMLDWLERTKTPSKIVAFGDSGGAATALKLARTDQRIEALIVEFRTRPGRQPDRAARSCPRLDSSSAP